MITIRPAVYVDLTMIELIYKELYSYLANLQPDYFREAQQHRSFLKDMISSKKAALLVAESSSNILGFIIVHQQKVYPHAAMVPHNYAYIIDLAVKESARKSGIGTSLIEAAIHWSKSRKLDYLELGVLHKNIHAKRLYEKLGFEDISSIMHFKL